MEAQTQPTALIIGAGPAGLTAALELLERSSIRPIVVESAEAVGGISRTVAFQGNRMDLGGHRFFSKSDWVMDWWQRMLPLEAAACASGTPVTLTYQNRRRELRPGASDPVACTDPTKVLLLRNRLSRIYFRQKFFDYPLRLDLRTVSNLGLRTGFRIALSLLRARLAPRPDERTLEDFLVNRFGAELYRAFFRDYTEKVWGVPCHEISAEWGAQRIKGVSLAAAVWDALRRKLIGPSKSAPISLTERFLYPRLGPGQLWEEVANRVRERGGEILMSHAAEALCVKDGAVHSVGVRDLRTGTLSTLTPDWVMSSMPVVDLVAGLDPPAPPAVAAVAAGLPYRHFITVGVLARRMLPIPGQPFVDGTERLPDNWIYIQDPGVKLGRVQIFNNWSPAMVADPGTVWLGLEYFCSGTDEFWQLPDQQLQALATRELAQIGLVAEADVLAATVVRVPKAYPAYFGSHAEFGVVRSFLDPIRNLFLIGRNGMHRYNNQDHSMLTARAAVDAILSGNPDKAALWDINVDDDYHEARTA